MKLKGLTVRRIREGKPGAGIKVVRLHYSADPTMTEERVAYLKTQYPDITIWNREMECDPYARSGKKVFPEFNEEIHMVKPFGMLPGEWTTYLACDPHPRRAHAFVWLSVNRYGDMVIPWSWWPEEENIARETRREGRQRISEYAAKLKDFHKDNPLNINPRFFLMDVAGKSFNADEEFNFFDAYENEGLFFQPAKKNRDYSSYDLIGEKLKLQDTDEGTRPTLTIMRGCGDNGELVWQLSNMRFREWKGKVTDKDPPKDPEEKRRHLVDDIGYILLSEPRWVDPTPLRNTFKPLYPKLGY